MRKKPAQEWKALIAPAIKSKEREFKMMGYHDVTADDIWNCLKVQVWKGNPKKRLHEVIQDVYQLKITTYMNYIRIGALRSPQEDLMSSINALTADDE